jgi:hypothetical protein
MALESMRGYVLLASGLGEMTKARAMEVAQGLLSLPGADEVTRRAVRASALADQLIETAKANRASLLRADPGRGRVRAEAGGRGPDGRRRVGAARAGRPQPTRWQTCEPLCWPRGVGHGHCLAEQGRAGLPGGRRGVDCRAGDRPQCGRSAPSRGAGAAAKEDGGEVDGQEVDGEVDGGQESTAKVDGEVDGQEVDGGQESRRSDAKKSTAEVDGGQEVDGEARQPRRRQPRKTATQATAPLPVSMAPETVAPEPMVPETPAPTPTVPLTTGPASMAPETVALEPAALRASHLSLRPLRARP